LDNEPEPDYDDDQEPDEDYGQPPEPWRLTRAARETILFCLVAGLIATLVWGIYRWTNASRFTPPVYSSDTTIHQ
jgi:hypothetical protein